MALVTTETAAERLEVVALIVLKSLPTETPLVRLEVVVLTGLNSLPTVVARLNADVVETFAPDHILFMVVPKERLDALALTHFASLPTEGLNERLHVVSISVWTGKIGTLRRGCRGCEGCLQIGI